MSDERCGAGFLDGLICSLPAGHDGGHGCSIPLDTPSDFWRSVGEKLTSLTSGGDAA